MQCKYISSYKHFLAYIGTKFGESTKQSIVDNVVVITEMVKPKKYTSKKELEEQDWDGQLEWKEDKEDYHKYS